MKIKLMPLLVLPVLLLTSCGDGAEVKDQQKIDEIKASIAKKASEIKGYEFTMTSDASSYNEEEAKNIKSSGEVIYRTNEKGEKYLKSTMTSDGKKYETTAYLVNNEEYKQVLYVSNYDEETKENEIDVYGYEGNEITFSFSELYFVLGEGYFTAFSDPNQLAFTELVAGEGNEDYDVDVKYYSKGDENLTIKAELKVKESAKHDDEEYATSATYTVHYDKGYFQSALIEGNSNKGNKSKLEAKMTVKNDIKIELPSGWEDLINKDAE